MSELITQQIFTDGQSNINASDMNGIIGKATVQPDVIANKPVSATMDVADQFLVLKTDNTLAKSRFDTIVNSTSSSLPVADATKNGMLKQVSGLATDYVGGDNACHPISGILPFGAVIDFAGPVVPSGWLLCDGSSKSRATYPGLFAAIGTIYGSVDGNSFNVPNFTGRIAAGAGGSFGALGATGGAASVTLAIGNLPSHSHSITDKTHSHAASASDSGHTHTYINAVNTSPGSSVAGGGTFQAQAANTGVGVANISVFVTGATTGITSTNASGSGTAVNILNPYLVINKMIKAA